MLCCVCLFLLVCCLFLIICSNKAEQVDNVKLKHILLQHRNQVIRALDEEDFQRVGQVYLKMPFAAFANLPSM